MSDHYEKPWTEQAAQETTQATLDEMAAHGITFTVGGVRIAPEHVYTFGKQWGVEPVTEMALQYVPASDDVYIAALRMAIHAGEPQSLWRGMATAPTDGTSIIVHEDDVTFMAFWGDLDAYRGEAAGRMGWMLAWRPEWEVHPTHWQPLPEAPKE